MCNSVRPQIKFGTDGWRGVISDDFTFENVRIVAQAIADFYNRSRGADGNPGIIVGYDTRFLSDRYGRIVSDVLAANAIDVFLSDKPVPTPTLSFAVKNRKRTAGVMITASHNPAAYNGIKIKTAEGGAAGVEITRELEKLIAQPDPAQNRTPSTVATGDLVAEYVKFLRGYVDFKKLANARFRVLVDPMHGSGNIFFKNVLQDSRIKLEFIRQEINPSFEGLKPEPVLENLEETQRLMKKDKFDLGIVLDGDADRIAAFAGNGEFINPQKILGLLILHLVQNRGMTGGVIKTVVGTNLIDSICKKLGLHLYETPVGFKYISELMVKNDIIVGGEEAGGIGFKNYIPERDGTLAGLLLMEMMVCRKQPISKILADMEKEFGRYYYRRSEIKLNAAGSVDIADFKGLKKVLDRDVVSVKDGDGMKFILADASWLILRASGTEPIIRVYAESKSAKMTAALLEFGRKLILKQ
jgi:alpha-D-glucose phosphate-specific phosphoglucomutase